MDIEDVVKYFHEIGHCKMETRSGWKHIGVKDPESVAEHSFRAAQIGFILAYLENYSAPEKIAMILLFHDNQEARVSDFDKLAGVYIDKKEPEMKALQDQILFMDSFLYVKMINFFEIFEKEDGSIENILAKDADLLELAFQAKEYLDQGYKGAELFLDNIKHLFKTESAKKIFESLSNNSSSTWWISAILDSNILKQKKE